MEITLSSVLSDIGSVFTSLIEYVFDICEIIATNPLLLIGFCVPIAYFINKAINNWFLNNL